MHLEVAATALVMLVFSSGTAALADPHQHNTGPQAGQWHRFVRVRRGGGVIHLIGDETVASWDGGSAPGKPAIKPAGASQSASSATYTNILESINAGLGVPQSLLTRSTTYPSWPTTSADLASVTPEVPVFSQGAPIRAGYDVPQSYSNLLPKAPDATAGTGKLSRRALVVDSTVEAFDDAAGGQGAEDCQDVLERRNAGAQGGSGIFRNQPGSGVAVNNVTTSSSSSRLATTNGKVGGMKLAVATSSSSARTNSTTSSRASTSSKASLAKTPLVLKVSSSASSKASSVARSPAKTTARSSASISSSSGSSSSSSSAASTSSSTSTTSTSSTTLAGSSSSDSSSSVAPSSSSDSSSLSSSSSSAAVASTDSNATATALPSGVVAAVSNGSSTVLDSSTITSAPPSAASANLTVATLNASATTTANLTLSTGSAQIMNAIGLQGQLSSADQSSGQGWGSSFASKYTTANVKNHGVAGASARSYYRDVWPTTLQVINSGDVVVLEFGHYDNKMPGSVADVAAGCVGSVPGAGSQTMTVTGCDGSQEVVRTFGAYLQQMCSDAQAKGATCVISSLTPKNEWRRGTSNTFVSMYPSLAKQAAAAAGATYLPHEEAAISILNTLGQSLSGQTFLSGNSQQTNVGGADLMAASFVAAAYCAGVGSLSSQFTALAQALTFLSC